MKTFFSLGLICALSGASFSQSLNVDFETPSGELGGGPPSDGFGAAANSPGRWNGIGNTATNPLVGLDGMVTSATLTIEYPGPFISFGGYNFQGNTGDHKRLLNDAIGVDYDWVRFRFAGLSNGNYEVFCYAVHRAGWLQDTKISVLGSPDQNPQIVRGPMPGNSLGYLVTHSIHTVSVSNNQIVIEANPGDNQLHNSMVNGIQIVAVPEPATLAFLTLGTLALLKRRSRH